MDSGSENEESLAASAATLANALVSTMLEILKSNFGIEMPRRLARRGRNLSRPSRVSSRCSPPWVRRGSVQSHSGSLPRTTDIPTFTAHAALVFDNGDGHVVARPTSTRARKKIETTPLPAASVSSLQRIV